jgi:GGDEF domain-containing protein
MYPAVFSENVVLSGDTRRKAFFGFCTLSVLLLGYLVDRQIVIRQLRRRLEEQQQTNILIRSEASTDLLETLPGFEHFRDNMAMECRRAAATHQSLSVLGLILQPAHNLVDPTEISTAFGDAAKAMLRKLRGEDSIYLFSAGAFGVILPGVSTANAHRVASRLADGLHDAAGASNRFTHEVKVFNFPEHAGTARELEEAIRGYIPARPRRSVRMEIQASATHSQ